jgi:hypothetical protein
MADAVEIYLDLSTITGRACKPIDNQPLSTLTLGPFYQGSLVSIRVYPIVATGNQISSPYFSKLDLTNLDFQLVLGPRAGAENILAAQYTWMKQVAADSEGKSGYFYADLNLNTSALNTAIGSSDQYTSAYLEFRISRSGAAYTPVFQVNPTIVAVVKDPTSSSSVPTPTPSYLTRDECLNLFVMWNNTLAAGGANNGRNIILASPDGTRQREIGVGNDGAPIDNAG